MKLYSKGQVILITLASASVAFLLAIGLSLLPSKSHSTAAAKHSLAENNALKKTEDFVLQESSPILRPIANGDFNRFSPDEQENIRIYNELNSAVVNITTETVAINWFLEPVPQDGGSGSGSIIDTRGYVLTNYHVVEKAYKILITLADGSQYEGTLIGSDSENDLAVLKFNPPKDIELHTIPFGESSKLNVGQKVLAIGNPFALERTLTVGIVSGLGRPVQTSRNNVIRDMIQTDASINPGNSGGPLIDSSGKMIGVNTMIYSTSGGSVGIGFAVPVNTAKRVVSELIQYGRVRRGWIDANMVQLFPSLVNYARLPVNNGLLISQLKQGGLAEAAGLKAGTEAVRYGSSIIYLGGDIITKVDGVEITKLADLYAALEDNKPGEIVDIEYIRDNVRKATKIKLSDRASSLNRK